MFNPIRNPKASNDFKGLSAIGKPCKALYRFKKTTMCYSVKLNPQHIESSEKKSTTDGVLEVLPR